MDLFGKAWVLVLPLPFHMTRVLCWEGFVSTVAEIAAFGHVSVQWTSVGKKRFSRHFSAPSFA